jgi:prolyl-tRNA editing enzyme YbaK/EbsC (Cys-tRNA(Pro) deacylase)
MTTSPSSVERVRAALVEAGITATVREFPASTRSAAEAAAAIETQVAQIVKSLIFLSADRPVLALMSGINRLDLKALARLTNAPVGKADADAVRRHTGYAIGGVPPAGFPEPISTFIDRDLLQYEEVWAAAGTPHHVVRLTPVELLTLTGGTVADLKANS